MITRRGFLKAAAGTIAIVAAMPNLAEAEVKRFWQLDQTQLTTGDLTASHLAIAGEYGAIWDVRLTPMPNGPFMIAEWSDAKTPRDTPFIQVARATQVPIDAAINWVWPAADPYRQLRQLMMDEFGEGAELGQVQYGYGYGNGSLDGPRRYVPILSADRLAQRR